MSETLSSLPTQWLTLIGLGEDGPAGLTEETRQRIASAPIVYGGARHLELVAPLIGGETHSWLSPFERSIDHLLARRGMPTVVLASGDPFWFGIGATLSRFIPPEEMYVISGPSAFSLAAARLGWPMQSATLLSLHGRPIDLLRPHLHPGRKIIALTSDATSPEAIAALLTRLGFGRSTLTLLEAMGGPRERVTLHQAASFSLEDIDALNVMAVEVVADRDARLLPLAQGLDDALFSHDGQITKREVRAMTLSALAPRHGDLLWDIGAGSGSVSIEWLLADPSLRAIAIEGVPERTARIRRNADDFGVPMLQLVEGTAPEALTGLAQPDAIFIGGGGSEPGVMEAAKAALKPGGRLVANGVTTEMEAVLLAEYARHGGSLTRIDISRVAAIGTMHGWRTAMPVTQWCWTKPETTEIAQ
ncbi:precorrin-6y C5,15-methyltransferase (decarboxylating) subunit CbiE [Rhizobium tumorigenes]|uniref:precorrin-6y C5,15-methyltransferase (decarboxylating) subunit CbiE n=1 Tax=Rhizobium tumorigenes TaxID=2041385 RepID=UPI00241F21EA|nr:precorrin-6y C5,15-methyltransferase (decarboxylating) subunit CbiE [Rhizobium tumorigenes]WFS00991.1 precorrin-6y C5,15-methyltransferase (decarboxylating) subunit CbiE [Rhizobium tumorigenes]